VQVDPIKPKLKAPGTKLLKLEHDNLLSSFAFELNLRRYDMDLQSNSAALAEEQAEGRGLHSSTFQLNLSRF